MSVLSFTVDPVHFLADKLYDWTIFWKGDTCVLTLVLLHIKIMKHVKKSVNMILTPLTDLNCCKHYKNLSDILNLKQHLCYDIGLSLKIESLGSITCCVVLISLAISRSTDVFICVKTERIKLLHRNITDIV